MSIENMEALPPNGHTLPAYDDGVMESAPEIARLRDALDGALGLAELLRRDSIIEDLHRSSAFDATEALRTGVPFGSAVRTSLEAALCTCLQVAHQLAHTLADTVREDGSAGLAMFAEDRLRTARMPKLKRSKGGAA